jgi:Fe-S cluster assembly protein SufD
VTHASGKTQSTQLFKYVAGGQGRGVYQGKVTVAQGANGSDSRQTAKGLLLGNRAEIDLKPELEILADDVQCAHGAAVGDLDAESLFYLRSRGIPEAEARALLMRAFIGDAVEQIEDETIRASIWQAVDAVLEGLS